jgi:hypothetical protein
MLACRNCNSPVRPSAAESDHLAHLPQAVIVAFLRVTHPASSTDSQAAFVAGPCHYAFYQIARGGATLFLAPTRVASRQAPMDDGREIGMPADA